MFDDERRDGVGDDDGDNIQLSGDVPTVQNDDDILEGIWASFTAPRHADAPEVSVDTIKARLKRGAARRRAELGDSNGK